MSTFSYTFWPYSLFRFIQFHFMLCKKYLILKYARMILMDRKSPIQIIAKKFPSFQEWTFFTFAYLWVKGRKVAASVASTGVMHFFLYTYAKSLILYWRITYPIFQCVSILWKLIYIFTLQQEGTLFSELLIRWWNIRKYTFSSFL